MDLQTCHEITLMSYFLTTHEQPQSIRQKIARVEACQQRVRISLSFQVYIQVQTTSY